MDTSKILELFNKSEQKLKASFEQLPKASPEEQALGIIQIQQSSYFLEKINQILFYKITKDIDASLNKLRDSNPSIYNIKEPKIENGQITFCLNNIKHNAPILSIKKLTKIMGINENEYSGKFIQMGFLLRPENLFDISIIAFLKENKDVIL